MKCEVCSAPITLEDEFCPYCGALNRPARKHLEDMKRYHMDYMNTKSEVLTNVGRQSRRHAQIIAVVLLVLLNVILLAGHAAVYDLQDWLETAEVKRNAKVYERQMSELQAEGAYAEMYQLYIRKNIYQGSDELRTYSTVAEMGYDLMAVTDGFFYMTHPEVKTYNTREEEMNRIAQQTARFYDSWKHKDNGYSREYYREDHLAAMKDMKVKLEAQLMAYGHLTEEEIAALPDKKAPEILVMLLGKEAVQ